MIGRMSSNRGLVLVLALAGLARAQQPAHQHAPAAPAEPRLAVCVLQPTQGNQARGVIRFVQVEGGVRVVGELTNLSPGRHGFHIHELGDVSAPDGTSAGGHYNPGGHPHAGPAAPQRHAGDLGNVEADAQGRARYDATLQGLTIAGPRNAIIGRSLVLHEKPDDLTTQPSGGAGARIAVGVIGVAADTTAPTVTVVAPREGTKLNANPVTVVVEVTDDVGVQGVTINGAAATPDPAAPNRWRAPVTATRGQNRVAVEATDQGGNKAQAALTFAWNDQAPQVQAQAQLVVEGRVDDLTCTLTINGQPVQYDRTTGAYSARVTPDPQNPRRITIVATDEYGNARTEVRELR